ncbi:MULTISPECIES: ATP-binding protein [Brevundimonas]|uniref:Adenylate kinase n=1 Tax=Brevundimonas faecalis TaxID=947378 RepID=A0ABV2R9T8_9CAUL
MPKVIYLTGAPASGKSSTSRLLNEQLPSLLIWEYGKRLTQHCRTKYGAADHEDLRARSSAIVTPEDIVEVDRALLEFVSTNRDSHPILIDSHPVTKEDFGFRITAFSASQLSALDPSEIWVTFVSPEETCNRIAADNGGRPAVTEEEARMHTGLQASIAAIYGVTAPCPVYLFDTGRDQQALVKRLVGRLS